MAYLDNPAGRLLAILEKARAAPQNENAASTWSGVFGLEYPKDSLRLLGFAAQLGDLAQETRRAVEAIPDEDPDVLLEHFGEVERTLDNFQVVASQDMRAFLEPLKPTGEYALKVCSSLLHRRRAEPHLKDEDVTSLRDQVHELIEAVLSADDLDPPTTKWILDRLDEVERALRNVAVGGHRGVEQEVDQLVGGLRRRPQLLGRIAQSKVRGPLIATLTALDLALNGAANLRQLTEGQPPMPSPVIIEIQHVLEESATANVPSAVSLPAANE